MMSMKADNEKAEKLYRFAKRWNEESFEKFMKALEIGLNTLSLQILRNDPEPTQTSDETNTQEFSTEMSDTEILDLYAIAMLDEVTWDFRDSTKFQIQRALGSWYPIEGFNREGLALGTNKKCEKYTFCMSGTEIEVTHRYKWADSNKTEHHSNKFIVKNEFAHHWVHTGWNKMWVKMDYEKWGLQLWCQSNDFSKDAWLFIMGRERTLPEHTLETLRNYVAELDFPRDKGFSLDQSP